MTGARPLGLLALGLIAGCVAAPPPAPSAPVERRPLSPAEIAERALPSVVRIETDRGQIGSGFVVAPGGRIVTNAHVIRDATRARVRLADGRVFEDVALLDHDLEHDLAMLVIDADGLRPLPLARGKLRVGSRVVVIGNPQGLDSTVSDGLLSGTRRDARGETLQISAPISPGSSGGPVFDEHGRVIGVSTKILNSGQNLNFAMPIRYVAELRTDGRPRPISALPKVADPAAARLIADCSRADVVRIYVALHAAAREAAALMRDDEHAAANELFRRVIADQVTWTVKCKAIRGGALSLLPATDRMRDEARRAETYAAGFAALERMLLAAVAGADRRAP